MKNIVIVILAGLVTFLLIGMIYLNIKDIDSSVEAMGSISTAQSRAKAAEQADKKKNTDILIGTITELDGELDKTLMNGIRVACSEINDKGGILGRKIKLLEKHIKGNDKVAECKNALQELIWNNNIVAVIGGLHYDQFINIAPLCDFNGLLLISPTLTSGIVPYQDEFKFSFVNFSNIRQSVEVMYSFLKENELQHTMIVSSPEFHYGYYFSNAFERFSTGKIHIFYRQIMYLNSHISQVLDLKVIKSFREMNQFDSVLIGLLDKEMVESIIEYLQKLDFLPICMMDDEMEAKSIANLKACKNIKVYLPSTYDPDSDKPAVKKFIEIYSKKFRDVPDTWAAQGYDTVNVLAEAMKLSSSTVPSKVADELYKIKYEENVTTAPYLKFDKNGELSSGRPIMKCMENGQFKVLHNLKIKPAEQKK